MGKMKELWIDVYDTLYSGAIEDGMCEVEAEVYASERASVKAAEDLAEHGEYLADAARDRAMYKGVG